MLLEEPSKEDRQSALAEVERLRHEYLEATSKFEHVLQSVLEGNTYEQALMTLMDAENARNLALDRYVAAAAESAGED
jgi:hypothetical protein